MLWALLQHYLKYLDRKFTLNDQDRALIENRILCVLFVISTMYKNVHTSPEKQFLAICFDFIKDDFPLTVQFHVQQLSENGDTPPRSQQLQRSNAGKFDGVRTIWNYYSIFQNASSVSMLDSISRNSSEFHVDWNWKHKLLSSSHIWCWYWLFGKSNVQPGLSRKNCNWNHSDI